MKPFILRRLKSEVLKDLPKKSAEIIKCPLIKKQKDLYTNLLARFSAEAKENSEVDGTGMLMQLRKLANHPLLIQDYYKEDQLRVGICISYIKSHVKMLTSYYFLCRTFRKD